MHRLFLPSLLVTGCLISPALAQQPTYVDVTLSGELIETATGATMEFTDVALQSGNLDLAVYFQNNQPDLADVTGRLIEHSQQTMGQPTILVDAIVPSVSDFRVTGDSEIGGTFTLRYENDPLPNGGVPTRYYTFLSFAPDFLALRNAAQQAFGAGAPNVWGVLWLDFSILYNISSGPLNANNNWLRSFDIPNDPQLVGLTCYFQSATVYDMPNGVTSIHYRNPDLMVVEAP